MAAIDNPPFLSAAAATAEAASSSTTRRSPSSVSSAAFSPRPILPADEGRPHFIFVDNE
jgi:hypothetical protein